MKSGSVQLENYIAEFDKLKKQIDTLQIAVDKTDVVKRSGGTMTGNLTLEYETGKGDAQRVAFKKKGDAISQLDISSDGATYIGAYDRKTGKRIWRYSTTDESFTVDSPNTNLVKKTGDTMTGYLRMDTESGEKGIIYKDNTAEFLKVYTGKNRNHGLLDIIANKPVYEYDFNTKTFSILADFKTKNDTDWINLTLLNGVKQQSSQPAS
ncbi:hypothetical protein QMA02_31835, partial [Bacillus wiedmannii]|nr:hypothetical protein [Bacillus wiedmannii]